MIASTAALSGWGRSSHAPTTLFKSAGKGWDKPLPETSLSVCDGETSADVSPVFKTGAINRSATPPEIAIDSDTSEALACPAVVAGVHHKRARPIPHKMM